MYLAVLILIFVAFLAEQVICQQNVDYPYRHGLLVFRSKSNVPGIHFWLTVINKYRPKSKMIIIQRGAFVYEHDTYNGEIQFRFKDLMGDYFQPILFLGQIKFNANENNQLNIRVGYATALFMIFLAFSMGGLFESLLLFALLITIFSAFYSSYKKVIKKEI